MTETPQKELGTPITPDTPTGGEQEEALRKEVMRQQSEKLQKKLMGKPSKKSGGNPLFQRALKRQYWDSANQGAFSSSSSEHMSVIAKLQQSTTSTSSWKPSQVLTRTNPNTQQKEIVLIETERCTLKPLTTDDQDAQLITKVMGKENATQSIPPLVGKAVIKSEKEAAALLKAVEEEQATQGVSLFKLQDKHAKLQLGIAGLRPINWVKGSKVTQETPNHEKRYELCYTLVKGTHFKGFETEVPKAIIAAVEQHLNIEKKNVVAYSCDETTEEEIECLTSIGMKVAQNNVNYLEASNYTQYEF